MRHYKENLAISLHRRRLYMQTILPYKTPTFVCKLFFVIPGGYPSGVMGEKIEIESPKGLYAGRVKALGQGLYQNCAHTRPSLPCVGPYSGRRMWRGALHYGITYHFMLADGFIQLMRNLTRVMVTHFNGGSNHLDFCYYFSARLLLLLLLFLLLLKRYHTRGHISNNPVCEDKI
jgi:hypothetical protein